METFSKKEIKSAKQCRNQIIKDDITELKAIYMSGEICMWDELQSKLKESDQQNKDSDDRDMKIFDIGFRYCKHSIYDKQSPSEYLKKEIESLNK